MKHAKKQTSCCTFVCSLKLQETGIEVVGRRTKRARVTARELRRGRCRHSFALQLSDVEL